MASCLQKLLKKPPPTKLIFSLHTQQSPNLTATPLLLNHQAHMDTVPDHHHHRSDSFPPTSKENLTRFTSSFFYPNVPFGFFIDPILSTGSILSEPEDTVSDGGLETVWADSVKKKRKKKMNKHKYKKLRKRLRKQT